MKTKKLSGPKQIAGPTLQAPQDKTLWHSRRWVYGRVKNPLHGLVDAATRSWSTMESLTTQIPAMCLISIDLKPTKQVHTTGSCFSLGHDDKGALIAATDEFPRGNGFVGARWGGSGTAAAWNALLQQSRIIFHSATSPAGLTIRRGAQFTWRPTQIQTCAGPMRTYLNLLSPEFSICNGRWPWFPLWRN